MTDKPLTTAILLFDQFELLDVFGPAEMFGLLKSEFELELIGTRAGPIPSYQGPEAVATRRFSDVTDLDLLLVPGGLGARTEVGNEELLAWLSRIAETTEYVTTVCTGAALIAKAGLLDGRRATTNKSVFDWVASQGAGADWVYEARWVEDGKFWTSSGVSAGIDMALALIERIAGRKTAEQTAIAAEYEWHRDPSWDPFAAVYRE